MLLLLCPWITILVRNVVSNHLTSRFWYPLPRTQFKFEVMLHYLFSRTSQKCEHAHIAFDSFDLMMAFQWGGAIDDAVYGFKITSSIIVPDPGSTKPNLNLNGGIFWLICPFTFGSSSTVISFLPSLLKNSIEQSITQGIIHKRRWLRPKQICSSFAQFRSIVFERS